jgi:hypothetical protein
MCNWRGGLIERQWRPVGRAPQQYGGTQAPVALCLAAVVGIGLLLRTQHLSDLTMHFDECCSWKISQFPWDEMIDAVSRDAEWDGSEPAARLPSVDSACSLGSRRSWRRSGL